MGPDGRGRHGLLSVTSWLTSAEQTPSPNHRFRVAAPLGVVLHFDRSPNDDAGWRWLTSPLSRASAHFHIARTGLVRQLVALDREAWHAGVSKVVIGGIPYAGNPATIGIELANVGSLVRTDEGKFAWEDNGVERTWKGVAVPRRGTMIFPTGATHTSWWEPYPEPQLASLERLLAELAAAGFANAVRHLFGHDEIAMPLGRKLDPGPLFPWQRFSRLDPRPLQASL